MRMPGIDWKCIGLCGLLLLGGCSESTDEPDCGPAVPYGYIAGRIEADRPITDAIVAVRQRNLSYPEAFEVYSPVDAEGRFSLAVPAGDYTLAARVLDHLYAYSASGAENGYQDEADMLSIAARDSAIVFFRFGTLAVEVSIAEDDWEAQDVRLLAYWLPEGDRWYWARNEATIRAGVARFEMNGLPAGDYKLELELTGPEPRSSEKIWLPGTHDRDEAAVVSLAVGDSLSYQAHLPGEMAELSGHVIGSWQAMGLDSPMLALLTSDSLLVQEALAAEDDGSFRLVLMIPERVRVACEIEDTTRWIGGDDFASATEFELSPGAIVDAGTIEESGLLLELVETYPASSWRFGLTLVRAEDGSLAHSRWISRSSDTNLLPIANLDPGVYYLHLTNPRLRMDWMSQWYDGAASMSAATPITVPSGTAVPLTLTLAKGGSIGGSVLNDFEGAPSWFVIYVTQSDFRETIGRGPGCHDGGYYVGIAFPFTARGLADGDYKVGAWPGDCDSLRWDAPDGTIWFPGTADWDSAGVVTITEHAEVTGIDIPWPQ
jgi:hypothetical protein